MGEALQPQDVSRLQPDLVGQAGGVRGTCNKDRPSHHELITNRRRMTKAQGGRWKVVGISFQLDDK